MGEHSNGITQELALLHTLSGADYARQVECIAMRNEFYPLKGEHDIFVCGGERDRDYNNLLNAARKAVEHGYTVFLLPNPNGTRSADIILKKKNIYRMYDVKTIIGKSSAGNRLLGSIGQTNCVLLNVRSNYHARVLALDIRQYFEQNPTAGEVMVFKGKKKIVVKRGFAQNPIFVKMFRKLYEQ